MSSKYWCSSCEAYVSSSCFDADCPLRDVTDESEDDEEVQSVDFHKYENDSILTSFEDDNTMEDV